MEITDFQKKKLQFHENALKYYKEPLSEKQRIRKEFIEINKLRKRTLEIQKKINSKKNELQFYPYNYYYNWRKTINISKITEEIKEVNIAHWFDNYKDLCE